MDDSPTKKLTPEQHEEVLAKMDNAYVSITEREYVAFVTLSSAFFLFWNENPIAVSQYMAGRDSSIMAAMMHIYPNPRDLVNSVESHAEAAADRVVRTINSVKQS